MSVCLSGPFDAAAVLKRLNTEPQITLYSAVPTLHQLIFTAKSESDLEDSYPSLRLIRSCSAHLPSALARSLALALDVEVLPTYAMTESMPIASPAPHGGMRGGARPRFHGTLGWAAGPEVRLLTDPLTDLLTADDVGPMATRTSEAATTTSRTLKPLEEGLEGEICVRGACVTRGYELRRDEEDPNRDAFVEGWFRTGDLAKVCKEGLILSGRNKEIINKSGEKFAPLQIEEVYLQHPLIKDCVAFAATCEKRGEAIGLAIETGDRSEEDLQQCNLDALRMFGRRTQELRLVARAPSDAAPGAFHFTLRLAQRFERFSQRVDVAAGAAGIGEVLRTVRDVVMELVRCDFEDDQPLMDVGIDSLSATTLINRLEMKLDINLAGDDGAVSLLDKYPSLQKLAAAAFLAMQKKDIDTASARSTHRPRMPYFGLGRRTSLKQFVVDARDPNSLLFAAQHGHAEQIRRSCEGVLSSMSPDEEVDKNGLTALHYAAGKGDLEIVGLLLELKAGVDTRNKDLRTPLMWAARNGHVDVCEELVRCQADVLASNKLGICCLHWAAWGGSLEAVAFLLEKEANIDAVCHAGCNVAVWAATAGSFDMCQWLHQKRADFASTNKNGHGVLNKACWRGHSVKLISWMLNLEGVEAQLFESDWDGELPLDRARQKGHSALAEWLRDEMCERRPSWQDCAKQSSEEDPKVPDCAKGAALDL
ncbi:Oxalate--CoA ligase (4-coumarate--CoA ligase isoform 8) (At4CL8) (4-coumarate--CoA ligase-like 10) (Acyl-activating enzyme 3) (Adenosine monophosphate binding protein 3) (AtMPBP3) (Oxalyl-CoA synthetase) [Durusdinium trenchii]|uniref:Carrier domain-containing protein n=1 Tax=Durusdinium trenchii TaxID=1381693 RepID=A0ABP0JRW1_9DINO